jgi:hypothetical protein
MYILLINMGIDMFSKPHSNLILKTSYALSRDTGHFIDRHLVDRLRCIASYNKDREEIIALAVEALQGVTDEFRRILQSQERILTNAARNIDFIDAGLVEDIRAAMTNEEEEKRGIDKDRLDEACRESESAHADVLKNRFAKLARKSI